MINEDILDIEIWKTISGYGQLYKISNFGRVKSLSKSNEEAILKAGKTKGYYHIVLKYNDNRKNYRIHRLVAEYFIPNTENKPFVNHKDGDKSNNHWTNLEWCTAKENTRHAIKMGLMDCNFGENSLFSKLTNKEAIDIFNSTLNNRELAKKYNITPEGVSLIKIGRNWSKLTGKKYIKKTYFTNEQVIEIFHSKSSAKELAEKFKVDTKTIYNIKMGFTYSDITQKKYKKKCNKLNNEQVID